MTGFETLQQRLSGVAGVRVATTSERPFPELIAAHRVKIRLPQGGLAICGRTGIRAATHAIQFDHAPADAVQLTVGDFTEIAGNNCFLLGGEHPNNAVFNTTFGTMPVLKHRFAEAGMHVQDSVSLGPIHIGSGAVISMHSIIRSGVRIGEGAVVGAGAVVTRDVPPFAIVAGSPARVLRYRFDAATIETLLTLRWWDLRFDSLVQHARLIADIANPEARKKLADSELHYDVGGDYIVLAADRKLSSAQFNVVGIERAGQFTPLEKAHEIYHFFCKQLGHNAGEPTYYFDNIFAAEDALLAA